MTATDPIRPAPTVHAKDARRLERQVAWLLRAGVTVAAIVVLAGGLAYLVRYGAEPVQLGVFRGEPEVLRSVPGIVSEAARLGRRGCIQFGLLLLIATPVLRVALACLAFVRQRDWQYAVISAIVLATLVASLFRGLW